MSLHYLVKYLAHLQWPMAEVFASPYRVCTAEFTGALMKCQSNGLSFH